VDIAGVYDRVEEKMVESLMKPVYAIGTNIVSALGMTTDDHWKAVAAKRTGIKRYEDSALSNVPFWASKIDPSQWQIIHEKTKTEKILSPFEQMAIYSAREALQHSDAIKLDETLLVLSTTKGNIEWLDQVPDERLLLHNSAEVIAANLGIKNKPVVISHACVSGVVAALYALRSLQNGRYKYAIVVGADRFTRFVLSGFQSFQAIADEPCKPFDAHRKGINLGEAAGTIILTTEEVDDPLARLVSGSTSNDANHISGPSRTGEELSFAIDRALREAKVDAAQIDMVSAHGTATLYNDEMESKAFNIAGVAKAPVHSFKGYIGHTLGAAGVVESAMIIESIRRQQLIPSAGFTQLGVSQSLNIIEQMASANLRYVLKTASGFGGCNATAIWGEAYA
jgi:3-oxoacyl-[acyl-carrier-protein] synthase I